MKYLISSSCSSSVTKNLFSFMKITAITYSINPLACFRIHSTVIPSQVEHVNFEKNTLDAYVVIVSYCHIVGEICPIDKISRGSPCPKISTRQFHYIMMIFAASRCGVFACTSYTDFSLPYKDRVCYLCSSAVKSIISRRNYLKFSRMTSVLFLEIIQKFSTQHASFESRCEILKQIAICNGNAHRQSDSLGINNKVQKLNVRIT